jgi:hypothetical protein
VPAKRERLSLVDFQVRQRLPLVDIKRNRLAIGEQINLRNIDRWTESAKRESFVIGWVQVRQRLPLADLKRKRLANGGKITCEILTGELLLQRQRKDVIDGFSSETEAAIGLF